MANTFRYPLTILESNLDFLGHVNNAAYLKILEEARWELVTRNGYGVEQIKISGLGPVVLEAHIKFIRELRLRQKVYIDTNFDSFQKIIAVVHQRIVDADDIVYCEAEFKFGLFNIATRKLVPPTREWGKALGLPENECEKLR